jgi:signal transduction histidine kinase
MPLKPHAIRGLLVEATAAHVHQAEKQQLGAELAETRLQLEASQRQLAELRASTQQFVDHLSHDFRTPLTVIQEFTSLVRDGLAGEVNGQQEAYLDIVADRATDLASMADEMFDSSKLEAGLLRLWRKPCHMSEIIAPLRASLERKARVKGVRLVWAIEADLPHVYCDAEKVGRVIVCLAANAIKTTKRGSSVEIWAAGEGGMSEVLIGVTDEGPGLSQETTEQLLESFQQSSVSARDDGDKKLSLAAALVRMNLGEMFIESRLEEGSTVWFSLPVAVPMTIVKRHLDILDRQAATDAEVSLIEISAATLANKLNLTPVIDEFLQQELTANELVLPAGPSRWLLLSRASAAEVNSRCDHLDRQRQALQEHSLTGGMPAIISRCLGAWKLRPGRASILQHFAAADLGLKQHESSELLLIV